MKVNAENFCRRCSGGGVVQEVDLDNRPTAPKALCSACDGTGIAKSAKSEEFFGVWPNTDTFRMHPPQFR